MPPVAAWMLAATMFSALDTSPHPAANSLVVQLSSRNWRMREQATESLAGLGRAAMQALREGQNSTDMEVATRCRRLLVRLVRWDGPLGWCDGGAIPREVWSPLYCAAGWGWAGSPEWGAYREGTRLWVVGLLTLGVPVEWLTPTLNQLVAQEREYRRKHGIPP